MSPPDWPLVLDGDDSAAFEAALGLVGDDFELDDHLASALLAPEELQCNSVGEASVSSRALVRGDSKEMEVVDAFLDEFDAVEEDAEELNEWSPHLSGTPSPSESDSVSSASSPQTKVRSQASRRNRVRPKQELTKLRREENELSYKLRELRLEARQRVLTGTTSRQEGGRKLQTRKHSLVFWERAASRQAHQRERSEQENRRLRAQLQVYIRHSRQLQQALNRRLLGSQDSALEFPRWALSIPTDNAVIFRKLAADVDAIYLSLDLSSAPVPKQDVEEGHPTTTMKHGAGKTVIFEHNRTSIVPFELRTVHQALWGSLGRELKNSSPNHQRTAVEYSGDVLHTSASVMTEPKYNFFMQSQSVARKYKTSDYALVISKSIVKPIGSDCGLVLGAIMTETNIRVLTQVETDDGEPLTCISTRTTLSREVLEGRFAHYWGQPEEVEITRAIWTRAMDARDRKLEEFLLHT